MKRLLAVDLGASGGKCFVGEFKDDGFAMTEIHRFAHEGVNYYVPDRDGNIVDKAYWDDTWLYSNILCGLRNFRREIGDHLDGIGVDTWGADGQLMSADGDPLGKLYCYRDHRLDPMIEQVKARIDPARIYEITGIIFQPFNLSNQLLWLVQNRPHLLLPGCYYLPIPSLIYHHLGGCRKVDSAWASVTQLMDAAEGCWSREVLDALGIPGAILPEIVAPGTVMGTMLPPLAEALQLNQATLLAVGSHDTASAFAAAPVDDPDSALIISSGTWSLVGKLIPKPITTADAMASGLSNEGGIGNTRFLKNCMGTWLVQELRRAWAREDGREMDWEEMNRLTAAAPAFTAFVDPDESVFYNPANMARAIDAFCERTGQATPADRGTYLRVIYESLALKYRQVSEQLSAATGSETRVVHIVGGGCRNAMLNQATADALGVPVVAGPEEGTAVGNLMVQALGTGLIGSLHDALKMIRETFGIKEFQPQDSDSWNAAYARFRRVSD